MKIHRAWIRATAAAAIAAVGTQMAVGQYAPYASTPQYSNQHSNVAPYGVPQAPAYPSAPTYQTAQAYPATPAVAPSMPVAQQPAAYPTTQMAAPAYPQARPLQQQATYGVRGQGYVQQPQMAQRQQMMRPGYPQVAGKTSNGAAPQNGAMPLPPQNGELLPTPADGSMNGDASMSYDPAAGNCGCGGYPTGGGYYGNSCAPDYGIGNYMECCDNGPDCFGGVYGLYMTRTKPEYRRYTVGVDTGVTGTPYFPGSQDTENMTSCGFLEPDYREGIEVRFGCTFDLGGGADGYNYGSGYGGYGDCGCSNGCNNGCDCSCQPCCCGPTYAWEFAYWGLDNDIKEQFVDGPLTGTFRYYGMINYVGLQYDEDGGGAGAAQPVNDFYNYQLPITGTGTETVQAQRVRTNFWVQNLEINLMRLPLLVGDCGCNTCGCDSCGCEEPWWSGFSITGLCGVRYFRVDDDFEFATEWGAGPFDGFDGASANELYHVIQAENNLVGFQLGANMNYAIGARCNVFWDSNFGLYDNYITAHQRMYNGLGNPVVLTQEGREFNVNSKKNDVAFLGELRFGAGYSFTEHWRGVVAYRAIAVSGVALSTGQIKPEYSNYADTALINADDSLIVHGGQAGLEFCY